MHFCPPEAEVGASENWDWRSQARPIHQKLGVPHREWCVQPSILRTNSEASMNPAILLVDSVSANCDELQSFLQSQQCDVDTAANGESAVRCCLEIQPDLVLLYDSLPDIGSFDLCRRLKHDPLNQLTPVVLVKPSPDQWDIYRGREAGALDIWAAKERRFETKHEERPLGSSGGVRRAFGGRPRSWRRRPAGTPPRRLASRHRENCGARKHSSQTRSS